VNALKAYLVSLFIVFLHFGSQIRYWTDDKNRWLYGWRPMNGVALVFDMFLIAFLLALAAGGILLFTRGTSRAKLRRTIAHILPVALVSGLLSLFSLSFEHRHPNLLLAIWMVTMLVIGLSIAWPRSRLTNWAYYVCLVFSPVPFVLSIQILTWGSWYDAPRMSVDIRRSDISQSPVFLFVFDEWSCQRSTVCGDFRPTFANVRRLCGQAITFREATSPYHSTELSIPRLIYQDSFNLLWRDGAAYVQEDKSETRTTDIPSLFQLAREHNYRTALIGFRLPYNLLLGNQVDYCRSYCCAPRGKSFLEETALALYRNLRFWTDPVSRKLWAQLDPGVSSQHYYGVCAEIREDMFRIIENSPENLFALFHVPHPHGPHVICPDGTYYGPNLRMEASDYERSLEYLDVLIGQIVERLRASDRFESALIVITSDHSNRFETDPLFRQGENWKCRVPLIVKTPQQQRAVVIDTPLCTNELRPLIEAVVNGERDPQRLVAIAEELSTNRP
jgi:hypothetical protein